MAKLRDGKEKYKYRLPRSDGEAIEKEDTGRKARSDRTGERMKERERKDTLTIKRNSA